MGFSRGLAQFIRDTLIDFGIIDLNGFYGTNRLKREEYESHLTQLREIRKATTRNIINRLEQGYAIQDSHGNQLPLFSLDKGVELRSLPSTPEELIENKEHCTSETTKQENVQNECNSFGRSAVLNSLKAAIDEEFARQSIVLKAITDSIDKEVVENASLDSEFLRDFFLYAKETPDVENVRNIWSKVLIVEAKSSKRLFSKRTL